LLFEGTDEGSLTDYRSGITGNKTFAACAARLGLQGFVLHGECAPRGNAWAEDAEASDHLLADVMEAFIGAVYLDQGLEACRKLLAKCIYPTRSDLPLRRCWMHATSVEHVPAATLERRADTEEQRALLHFERVTGLRFRSFGLLQQAFTHPSFYVERRGFLPPPAGPNGAPLHNQRLEWLGDAVLKLAASDYLFHHFPDHQEGQLTLLRDALVSNASLCDVAATCGMHNCMRYYHEVMDGPSRARRAMLAQCVEAFLGALFIDRQPLGMAACKTFSGAMLFSLTPRAVEERRWLNPKKRLRYCLDNFNALMEQGVASVAFTPLRMRFKTLEELGPENEKMFVVGCYVNEVLVGKARGQSILDAEMGAALDAAKELQLDEAPHTVHEGGGACSERTELPDSTK